MKTLEKLIDKKKLEVDNRKNKNNMFYKQKKNECSLEQIDKKLLYKKINKK